MGDPSPEYHWSLLFHDMSLHSDSNPIQFMYGSEVLGKGRRGGYPLTSSFYEASAILSIMIVVCNLRLLRQSLSIITATFDKKKPLFFRQKK
jgi:hypothetical protein